MKKIHGTISGIYKIQSRIKPERIYVGSSVNIPNRWGKHKRELRLNIHENGRLQNHVNKYGLEDLEFSLIVGCGRDVIIAYEQFYIDAIAPWFNICPTAGSTMGRIVSDETRERLRVAHLGQTPWNKGRPSYNKGKSMPEEQKEKLRQMRSGENNPMYGKRMSEEAKKKRAQTMAKFYESPEGLKHRAEISERMKTNHPMFNKHHTEEALNKMRKPRSEQGKRNIREGILKHKALRNGKTEILVPAL